MNISVRKATIATLLGVAPLILWSLYMSGCTHEPSGTQTANIPPIVWFVNVPPQDNQSSTNPIINWVGQDKDGQVVTFRYVVFREDTLVNAGHGTIPLDSTELQAFVDNALTSMPDSIWTYLDVQPEIGDPKTSNIIPMSAELADPVNSYVRQILFVQGFDEQGAGSAIVFRSFLRNDNPPDTRTLGFLGGPFINAVFPGGTITGIRMRWEGSDVVDYPTDPPPFEYEWRLYGPYFSDTINDSAWEDIQNNFIKTVFVTRDAQIFRVGEGEVFITCDTTPVADGDSVIHVETCDTILIDSITTNNIYGNLDTILDIDDPDFSGNPLYNRIAKQSFDDEDGDVWVYETRDSVYDAFWSEPSDTTQEQYFIYWIRSRDDASVPDLTPCFEMFSVIDPQYERDIGILDAQLSFSVNARIKDSARAYWERAIDIWADAEGITTNYVDSIDYITVSTAQGIGVTLRQMLAHKMLIVVNDNTLPGMVVNNDFANNMFIAANGGVNIWMCGRAQIFGGEAGAPACGFFEILGPGAFETLNFYFGLIDMCYSGWEYHLLLVAPPVRIEDFVGTLSLDTERWPDLTVDTALLHRRYLWQGHYPWIDTIAALPEVDWFIRGPATTAMYLYKSKYGAHHFLNDPDFDFQGKPVAHRVNRGLFRTVYFMFTPYAMEETTMQTTVNSVLSWLFDPGLSTPPADIRYRDAENPVSVSAVRELHFRMMEERARKDPKLAESFIGLD